MKLLIIRHGDPNYETDSLTDTGKIEAELLSRKLCKMDIDSFYVSPLGRARMTADYTLNKLGRQAKTLDWLRVDVPEFYDMDKWTNVEAFAKANVKEAYEYVCKGLDDLLAKHGYVRKGRYYEAVKANHDTICFVCHFGLESVLLSHLLNIPPMLLWHGTCAAPTSVTTLVTEERERGIACFRMGCFGDVSHLYAEGVEPSFSARFCETFDTPGQRH